MIILGIVYMVLGIALIVSNFVQYPRLRPRMFWADQAFGALLSAGGIFMACYAIM